MADHFDSVATDTELHDWIRYQAENGNSFMRTLSEAAMLADIPSYLLLRPVCFSSGSCTRSIRN